MSGQPDLFVSSIPAEHEPQAENELNAVAGIPWVAIALAAHMLLLVIAYFWQPAGPQRVPMLVITSQLEQVSVPPTPEQEAETPTELPRDQIVSEQPSENPRITPEATDTSNEDPTDQPNSDLADNPNEDPSDHESNHPNRESTTSAVGLAGGLGGGGGLGGDGGLRRRRSRDPSNGIPIPEPRVTGALSWLRDHQNRAGFWSGADFSADTRRTGARKTHNIEFLNVGHADGDKGWSHTCDVGLTGLALLAYLGAGYTHTTGEFAATCRRAVNYLRSVQANDGCFGSREDDHSVYNHAIATMAMAEACGMSEHAILRPAVNRAIEFILAAQNPGLGWRYGVRPGDNDTSVTGWMVLALKSCLLAGFEVDTERCYADAAKWFELATVQTNGYPRTGYNSPGSQNARLRDAGHFDSNPSMDSIYVMSMLYMGKADRSDPTIRSLSRECIRPEALPRWEPAKLDFYYWYYASLALYQIDGDVWKTWESAMARTLLDHQRGYHPLDVAAGLTSPEALDEHGSWDPVDAWGSAGGRVYATAINCLTIQVQRRYERVSR